MYGMVTLTFIKGVVRHLNEAELTGGKFSRDIEAIN